MYKKLIGLLLVVVFLFSLTLQTLPAQEEEPGFRVSIDPQSGEFVVTPDYAYIKNVESSKENNLFRVEVQIDYDGDVLQEWTTRFVWFDAILVGTDPSRATPPLVPGFDPLDPDFEIEDQFANKKWRDRLSGGTFGPVIESTYEDDLWNLETSTFSSGSFVPDDAGDPNSYPTFIFEGIDIPDGSTFGVIIHTYSLDFSEQFYHLYGIDVESGQTQIPFTISPSPSPSPSASPSQSPSPGQSPSPSPSPSPNESPRPFLTSFELILGLALLGLIIFLIIMLLMRWVGTPAFQIKCAKECTGAHGSVIAGPTIVPGSIRARKIATNQFQPEMDVTWDLCRHNRCWLFWVDKWKVTKTKTVTLGGVYLIPAGRPVQVAQTVAKQRANAFKLNTLTAPTC
jgi:hypothetical protein